MPDILIKNAKIVLLDRILAGMTVLCKNGRIQKISPQNELKADSGTIIIDAMGKYLVPGLIDLHIHGLHEYLIDNGPDDLANICKVLPRYGVTSFLPGVCPLPKGQDAELLSSLAQVRSEGTQILGFHLEGPFLSLTGALPPEAIGSTDKDRVLSLIEAAGTYKAIFSIAPDFEGVEDLIPVMAQNGNPVFITHTKADVKQTQSAIELGACHATHFYDVFYCPPETDPGVRPCGAVEAILADSRVSVDFILDGEHVDPVAVKMALECKGPDRVCLITDANVGAGLKPGVYGFGDEQVEFKYPGGPARLLSSGVLAGSGLTLNRAVKNAIDLLGVDLSQAVRMASANPAKVLGMETTKGRIEAGFDADMVLLDENYDVIQTWVKVECCFEKGVM